MLLTAEPPNQEVTSQARHRAGLFHARNEAYSKTFTLAAMAALAALTPSTLAFIGALLMVLLVAAGVFLHWYANLKPGRRADVHKLIRTLLGR